VGEEWVVGNRRASPRYAVAVEAVIRAPGGSEHKASLSNLSLHGCRCSVLGRRIPAGTRLSIAVGPVTLLHARIAWRVGAVHGISFDEALHPAVLDHIRLFLSTEPALIEERPAA
jgi:hypothetical protein